MIFICCNIEIHLKVWTLQPPQKKIASVSCKNRHKPGSWYLSSTGVCVKIQVSLFMSVQDLKNDLDRQVHINALIDEIQWSFEFKKILLHSSHRKFQKIAKGSKSKRKHPHFSAPVLWQLWPEAGWYKDAHPSVWHTIEGVLSAKLIMFLFFFSHYIFFSSYLFIIKLFLSQMRTNQVIFSLLPCSACLYFEMNWFLCSDITILN